MRTLPAWLGLVVLGAISASPLPAPTQATLPTDPLTAPPAVALPTPTPTLPAVVLAADAGQTLTVLDVILPKEHVDALRKADWARMQKRTLLTLLLFGIPGAIIGYMLLLGFCFGIPEIPKKWAAMRQRRKRVRANRKALDEWHRKDMIAQAAARAAKARQAEAKAGAETEVGAEAEGYKLSDVDVAPGITFAEPSKPKVESAVDNQDRSQDKGKDKDSGRQVVPGSGVWGAPSVTTTDDVAWANKDGATPAPSEYTRSEHTLPLYRTMSMETNATLPSYRSTDPYAVRARTMRPLRALFAGMLVLFGRRADAAPIPTGDLGLELGSWAAGVTGAAAIESALPLATPTGDAAPHHKYYAAFANRAIDAASAVAQAGPTITGPGPGTVWKTGPGYETRVLLTTTMARMPVAIVTVATSATVGGNIVPHGGWAMHDTAKLMRNLRMIECIVIPIVYVPAAIAVGYFLGLCLSVFFDACHDN